MGDGKIMAPARDEGQRAHLTAERWQQVKAVLSAALEKDTSERPVYLDQACAADSSLRAEVESLLAVEQDSSPHVLTSAWASTADSFANPRLGRRIGPYQLVEEIGAGGMGEVYRAFRADDQYKKEVAIKLVRAGQDSEFVVARFRNERQVLASLEHPNIARLLDGGTTDDGIPYFVMELIQGKPFIQYCDEHRLSITERLKLFLQVCSAVQYAHQQLIIHRDLKPGNVLVTADGIPKLLDFGIAKILGPAASSGSFDATMSMFRVLTPAYASPEQVKGEPISTASDTYSLGVILYECLTGRSPYGVTANTPHTIAQAVCEVEPGKPSTVIRAGDRAVLENASVEMLAAISAMREGTAEKLARRLRGDLDNIVLMALRKEPQRRYVSVEQFADDIRRHLNHLPVIARQDTIRYRAGKFVARHKAGVAGVATVVMVLILGIIVTVREERIAQRRFNDVRATANSLIFDVDDSIKDLPGSTPARKMIVERALQYLNALAADARGDIELQRELATAYERVGLVQGHYLQDNLGDTASSLASYQQALELRRQIEKKSRGSNDQLALARAYRLVAHLQWTMGNTFVARHNLDQALTISDALNRADPNDPKILYELGFDYAESWRVGYPDSPDSGPRSLADLRKALAIDEATLQITPDDIVQLHSYAIDLSNFGGALEETNPQGALTYYERVRDIEEKLTLRSNASKYARELAISYLQIASVYEDLGDYPRAVENDQRYLAMYLRLNAADPKNSTLRQGLAIAYANTADALSRIGRISIAIEDWGRGAAIMRELVSLDPGNARQRHKLAEIIGAGGSIFMRARQPQTALRYFREARDIYRSLAHEPTDDREVIANSSEKMGAAATLAGDVKSAQAYFEEALSAIEPLPSGRDANVMALYTAADAYSGLGDLSFQNAMKHSREKAGLAQARFWYLKSVDAWHRIPHPSHSGPNGIDVGDPKLVLSKLQRCEAALAGVPRP